MQYGSSRFMPAVVMALTVLCSPNLLAEQADSDLFRNLFQRLEVYLGIMQANEREHQNLLRSVASPEADASAKAGDTIDELSDLAAIRGQALAASALDWNMLQSGTDVNNTAVVTRHISGYCSAEEATIGICQVGLNVDEGGAADLLVDTLLASPTIGQLNNAISFIYMLTNPNPMPLRDSAFQSEDLSAEIPITSGTPMEAKMGAATTKIKTRPLTGEGVRTLAARYKQMALLSTAQFALNSIAAERGAQATGISAFAALKTEAERRFNSTAWHTEINQLPDTAVLREIATMQAMQLALEFKRYEQEQTLLTLLAAQVAMSAQTLGAAEAAYQAQ